jgi:histone H3/H4
MKEHLNLARDPAIGAHMAQYLEEAALKEKDDQEPASNNKKQAIDEVPLARIKRIMKQDSCEPPPRMVSVAAILTMAHVSLEFTRLLTSIAWTFYAKEDRRNTLQAKDLHDAVYGSQCFDFLVDVLDMFDQAQGGEGESGGAGEDDDQQSPIQLAYRACMQKHRSVERDMRHVLGMPTGTGPMAMPPGDLVQGSRAVAMGPPCVGTTAQHGMPAVSLAIPTTVPLYSSIEALHPLRAPAHMIPTSRDVRPQGQQQQLARSPSPLLPLDEDQDLLARLPSLSQLPSDLWEDIFEPDHLEHELLLTSQ